MDPKGAILVVGRGCTMRRDVLCKRSLESKFAMIQIMQSAFKIIWRKYYIILLIYMQCIAILWLYVHWLFKFSRSNIIHNISLFHWLFFCFIVSFNFGSVWRLSQMNKQDDLTRWSIFLLKAFAMSHNLAHYYNS